jgi:hypothetical protein
MDEEMIAEYVEIKKKRIGGLTFAKKTAITDRQMLVINSMKFAPFR